MVASQPIQDRRTTTKCACLPSAFMATPSAWAALTRLNRLPKVFADGLIAPEQWRSRTRKPGRTQEGTR
jgi:hypothetical protein